MDVDDASADADADLDFFCYDVVAGTRCGSLVLVGKTSEGATRCVEVEDVPRLVTTVVRAAALDGSDDGDDCEWMSIYAPDGTTRAVEVETRLLPGAESYGRAPSPQWHAYERAPIERALFASALRGPSWVQLHGLAAAERRGAALVLRSIDDVRKGALECASQPGKFESEEETMFRHEMPPPVVLPRSWSLLIVDVDAADAADAHLTLASAPALEGPWTLERAVDPRQRVAKSALAARITYLTPDIIVCYDEKRLRAMLGAPLVRDKRIRQRDPPHDHGTRGVAAERNGDGYVWCDMRSLGKQYSLAYWHDEAQMRASASASAGSTHPWLALLAKTHALSVALEIGRISGALWRHAIGGQRLLVSECILARTFIHRRYILPPISALGYAIAFDGRQSEPAATGTYAGARVLDAVVGVHGSGGGGAADADADDAMLSLADDEPRPGETVLRIDASSLYPSVVVEHRICYTNGATGSHGYVLPWIMRLLVGARRRAGTSADASQALKLCANALYGCTGAELFRFYSRRVASLIAEKGRDVLETLETQARAWCALGPAAYTQKARPRLVISGDTDAVALRAESRTAADECADTLERSFATTHSFVRVRRDALLARLVVVTRKAYVGVDAESGALVECGCAAQKGDAAVVRTLVDAVVEAVARGNDDALRAACESAAARIEAAPLDALVCSKKLSQPPSAYAEAARASLEHVSAALACANAKTYRAGDHVAFVALCTRAQPGATIFRVPRDARALLDAGDATLARAYYAARFRSLVRNMLRAVGREALIEARSARRIAGIAAAAAPTRPVTGQPLSARLLGAFSARPTGGVAAWTCAVHGAQRAPSANSNADALCTCALEAARAALASQVRALFASVNHAAGAGASADAWLAAHALVAAFERHFGVDGAATAAEMRARIAERVGAVIAF